MLECIELAWFAGKAENGRVLIIICGRLRSRNGWNGLRWLGMEGPGYRRAMGRRLALIVLLLMHRWWRSWSIADLKVVNLVSLHCPVANSLPSMWEVD